MRQEAAHHTSPDMSVRPFHESLWRLAPIVPALHDIVETITPIVPALHGIIETTISLPPLPDDVPRTVIIPLQDILDMSVLGIIESDNMMFALTVSHSRDHFTSSHDRDRYGHSSSTRSHRSFRPPERSSTFPGSQSFPHYPGPPPSHPGPPPLQQQAPPQRPPYHQQRFVSRQPPIMPPMKAAPLAIVSEKSVAAQQRPSIAQRPTVKPADRRYVQPQTARLVRRDSNGISECSEDDDNSRLEELRNYTVSPIQSPRWR
ncbi:hypothetical protein O1611_g4534 [Lasiodiplodia mahajangana]|uniref:Uncharacterized protein n=1 Tax=Lasiodiplodia mahajangana TaxID=1108764 RepID=A0ACC2JNL8_9PEZI|nr:hypothetical protein O1611_g4534 [Lasiodiplodia mahajangana]